MTNVLYALQQEGVCITPEVVRRLSPYLTEHIKRFGQYVLDMETLPEPLDLKPLCDKHMRCCREKITRIPNILQLPQEFDHIALRALANQAQNGPR